MTIRTIGAMDVALAFTRACDLAGQAYSADEQQSAGVRAANLLKKKYIREGDPHDWSSGEPIATVYCENQGGRDDCIPPADYYDRWPVFSDDLPFHWEWNNCAVGHVWSDVVAAEECAG